MPFPSGLKHIRIIEKITTFETNLLHSFSLKKNLLFYGVLLFLLSCNQESKPTISFYYWKTIFKLSSKEKTVLQENKVQKLYIRYFDLDWNANSNEAFPQSPIHFNEKPSNYTIVPVIYIKNKVFLNRVNIEDLVRKTNDFIQKINSKNSISCQEIQIDCDWSLESRDNYLQFITVFKKISGKKLSATIRLHQIKYFKKTKIPNVDTGVLMYYNMGKIAPDSLNSIYDRNIANNYLESLKNYPLPINIALPIYSWAVHIRDAKVIGLKNKIDVNSIKKDTNFATINSNWLRVINSNYKNGNFYRKDDLLKIEKINQDDLLEMALDLNDNCKAKPKEIIFYDLDEINIQHYEKEVFSKVINRF